MLAAVAMTAPTTTEPPPDRDAVEASFRAAVVSEYPDADSSLTKLACDVEGGVVCFAQFLDGIIPVVLTGIAPDRDPVDGPLVIDPSDWPWEISLASAAPAPDAAPDAGSAEFVAMGPELVELYFVSDPDAACAAFLAAQELGAIGGQVAIMEDMAYAWQVVQFETAFSEGGEQQRLTDEARDALRTRLEGC